MAHSRSPHPGAVLHLLYEFADVESGSTEYIHHGLWPLATIGSVETGKIGELYVFSELLRRGATVFSAIVDIKGIDAVVRKSDGTFLAVQVKTHSTEYMAEWFDVYDLDDHDPGTFVVVGINMRQYPPSEVWIVPAGVFVEYGTTSKLADGSTVYRLDLEARSRKRGNQLRRDLLKGDYLNAWHILTG